MKKVLLIALVLGTVSTAAAQTSSTGASGTTECKLKLAQAPVIRGIRLGMSTSQVLAMFPNAEKDESLRQRLSQTTFGSTNVHITPSNYESKEKFAGVRGVDFGFFDGELNSFFVMYDGPEWKNSDQFASKVAEALSLPGLEAWKAAGTYTKILSCDGFQIQVLMTPESGSSTVGVKNLEKNAANIVHERQEAVKDRARQAFKP